MKRMWKNLRQHIEILKLLPQTSKPIDLRIKASAEDRRQHWLLGEKYFDGKREQGYGGYEKDERWIPVAKFLIKKYKLNSDSKVLELGCAKGFLLSEIEKFLPGSDLWGLDISRYALKQAQIHSKANLIQGNFEALPFKKNFFDLVISINSIHNILTINETVRALREIKRISKQSIITVAAYNTASEKDFLDKWAVVATTYVSKKKWLRLFKISGYNGDYDWFEPWKK